MSKPAKSVVGQRPTWRDGGAMSALPRDADIHQQPVGKRAEAVEANKAIISVWNSPKFTQEC